MCGGAKRATRKKRGLAEKGFRRRLGAACFGACRLGGVGRVCVELGDYCSLLTVGGVVSHYTPAARHQNLYPTSYAVAVFRCLLILVWAIRASPVLSRSPIFFSKVRARGAFFCCSFLPRTLCRRICTSPGSTVGSIYYYRRS